MYASQRSVNKNSTIINDRKRKAERNRLVHRGMMKDHVQITPDGKVIQHYKMNPQATEIKKAIMAKLSEEAAKHENDTTAKLDTSTETIE